MLDYWGVRNSLRCRHIGEKIVKEDGKSLTKVLMKTMGIEREMS